MGKLNALLSETGKLFANVQGRTEGAGVTIPWSPNHYRQARNLGGRRGLRPPWKNVLDII